MRVLIHQSPGILAHPLSYRSPLIIAFDPGFNNPGRYAPEPSTASILANGKLSLSLSLCTPQKKRIKETRSLESLMNDETRIELDRSREQETESKQWEESSYTQESNSNKYPIYLALNARWRWWRLTIPRGLFSNNPDYSWIFHGEVVGSVVFRDCPTISLGFPRFNVSTRLFCDDEGSFIGRVLSTPWIVPRV